MTAELARMVSTSWDLDRRDHNSEPMFACHIDYFYSNKLQVVISTLLLWPDSKKGKIDLCSLEGRWYGICQDWDLFSQSPFRLAYVYSILPRTRIMQFWDKFWDTRTIYNVTLRATWQNDTNMYLWIAHMWVWTVAFCNLWKIALHLFGCHSFYFFTGDNI